MVRKRLSRVWLNPETKNALKMKALKLNKNLIDLNPEDLKLRSRKKSEFRFRI